MIVSSLYLLAVFPSAVRLHSVRSVASAPSISIEATAPGLVALTQLAMPPSCVKCIPRLLFLLPVLAKLRSLFPSIGSASACLCLTWQLTPSPPCQGHGGMASVQRLLAHVIGEVMNTIPTSQSASSYETIGRHLWLVLSPRFVRSGRLSH